MHYKTKTGDDFYTRGKSKLNLLTAYMTRAKGEGPTLATHQGKFYDSRRIIHALSKKGVHTKLWRVLATEYDNEGVEYCILRPPQPIDIDKAQDLMLEMVGWKYSKLELFLLQPLDALIAKFRRKQKVGIDAVVFRKLGNIWKKGVICSTTGNRVDIKLGILPEKYKYASPDDSYDWKINNGWRVIYKTPGWERE